MKEPNRRRHPRYRSSEIEATLDSPGDCRVINLSSSGICFETGRGLTVGENYFLEVHFQGMSASLEIAVKWCSLRPPIQNSDGTETTVARSGASFIDIQRDSPVGFWDLIEVSP